MISGLPNAKVYGSTGSVVNPVPIVSRTGRVSALGKTVVDDQGTFNPLGLTQFSALYWWKHNRAKMVKQLDWMAENPPDYLRILCEVDWANQTIDPSWSCTEDVLGELLDAAFVRGMRCQLTLVGGKEGDSLGMKIAELLTPVVKRRESTVISFEVCNEWSRLDKMTPANMEKVAKYLRQQFPFHLIGLSQVNAEAGAEHVLASDDWKKMYERCGANMYILHTRRSKHDRYWSHVRQGYDFKNFNRPGSNNEPQGPQSSVHELSNALQLAMARAVSTVCGAPFYVLHVGQGVTGVADSNHGRPEHMWEVPNIEAIRSAVRNVEKCLPPGVANWKVQNNAWPEHPLPLPGKLGEGFWEGDGNGSVNKNYAAVTPSEFCIPLCGVHVNQGGRDGDLVHVGTAKKKCRIRTYEPTTGEQLWVHDLVPGEPFWLPGRLDAMVGYIVRGQFT